MNILRGFKYLTDSNEQLDAILFVLNHWHKEMAKNVTITTDPNGDIRTRWVHNENNKRSKPEIGIDLHLLIKIDMQGEDFILALNHLCDENLIEIESKPINIAGDTYKINFKGRALIERGGFVQMNATANYEMKKAIRNEWMISRGAIFASVFAGALLIWDISKYLIEHNIAPIALSEACFYLIVFPCFFLLMWYIIKKLPS